MASSLIKLSSSWRTSATVESVSSESNSKLPAGDDGTNGVSGGVSGSKGGVSGSSAGF